MTEQTDLENHATQTFVALRGEVALLRRAIEGLSAERESVPDYGPTLTDITVHITEIASWARKINDKPAMTLTPESLEKEIIRVARAARDEDHAKIAHAAQRMDSVSSRIAGFIASALTEADQLRANCIVGCVTFLSGMLLMLGMAELDYSWARQDDAPAAVENVPVEQADPRQISTTGLRACANLQHYHHIRADHCGRSRRI